MSKLDKVVSEYKFLKKQYCTASKKIGKILRYYPTMEPEARAQLELSLTKYQLDLQNAGKRMLENNQTFNIRCPPNSPASSSVSRSRRSRSKRRRKSKKNRRKTKKRRSLSRRLMRSARKKKRAYRISQQIKKLKKKGYTSNKQRVAIALAMEQRGRLGPRGGYKKST